MTDDKRKQSIRQERRDPAVEAAEKVHRAYLAVGGKPWHTETIGTDCAREALAPIRAIVERLDYEQENFRGDSLDYLDLAQGAIEDIRLLIYTSEELSDD